MSFFTSLTGLNAATTQLSVTSNNIANAGTTGFKRSRSDFGDIFATSPLQKASTVVGQGTALKQVTQEFSRVTSSSLETRWTLRLPVKDFFLCARPMVRIYSLETVLFCWMNRIR